MINYIIQVVLFQVLFLVIYDFFLSKETFFSKNRWYLLGTSIVSFLLPLIKIPTLKKAVPFEYTIILPEIVLSPQKVIEKASWYQSINYIDMLFWFGCLIFTALFLVKLEKVIRLILKNRLIKKENYTLVLLPKETKAFSFFNFIFIGENISKEQQEKIIQHELVHSKQKHSLDLLLFEILKIVMWFNPMIYIYQKRITLVHEYISDEVIIKSTQKEHYINNMLSGLFQVEGISFINQFYKHSLIKKRIIMMTKEKSKQVKQLKYLLLIPVLVSMLVYTSCSENSDSKDLEIAELKEQNKVLKGKIEKLKEKEIIEKEHLSGADVPFAIIEEVPVYPGCVGTREEKAACLNKSIQKFIFKNFNAGLAKDLGLSKGKKKIWVQFKINKKGEVVDVQARAPHPTLKTEAIRVASMLPKMIPGKQRDKAVGMKYTVPISFLVE